MERKRARLCARSSTCVLLLSSQAAVSLSFKLRLLNYDEYTDPSYPPAPQVRLNVAAAVTKSASSAQCSFSRSTIKRRYLLTRICSFWVPIAVRWHPSWFVLRAENPLDWSVWLKKVFLVCVSFSPPACLPKAAWMTPTWDRTYYATEKFVLKLCRSELFADHLLKTTPNFFSIDALVKTRLTKKINF